MTTAVSVSSTPVEDRTPAERGRAASGDVASGVRTIPEHPSAEEEAAT